MVQKQRRPGMNHWRASNSRLAHQWWNYVDIATWSNSELIRWIDNKSIAPLALLGHAYGFCNQPIWNLTNYPNHPVVCISILVLLLSLNRMESAVQLTREVRGRDPKPPPKWHVRFSPIRCTVYLWTPCIAGCGHIYFHPMVSSFFFLLLFLFPRLISAVGHWMYTILPHMVRP